MPALRDVSFRVEPGELVALTGSSGSGKSTILNLIGALDTPDAGSISVDGQPARRARRARRLPRGDDRLRLPGAQPAADADRVRERAGADVRPPAAARARGARARAARARSASRAAPTRGRACSPAASASASRSPARSRTSRGCCSRTSRPARSTPTTGAQVLELLDRRSRAQHGMTILLVTNDDDVAAHADRDAAAPRRRHSCRSASIGVSLTARHVG